MRMIQKQQVVALQATKRDVQIPSGTGAIHKISWSSSESIHVEKSADQHHANTIDGEKPADFLWSLLCWQLDATGQAYAN